MALAFGSVIFYVFATGLWLVVSDRSLIDALVSGFMYTLLYWLLAMFQLRNVRKTKRRLDEQGQFKAFLRYPDSRPGSLSGIWNQGVATPDAGLIRFQPAVYDSLEPSGRATDFKVQTVLPDRRKIAREERKYLPAYGYLAVTLLTDGGKVEIAASPDSLDKLIEVVASGPA
ncbi:hypothetical protein AC792_00500 [Arthrobacter sp. RIT-PI-e]|nr:hypothetical protein AC792_00500 [Arthrobacter sp. RIT-PI-e]